MKAKYDSPVQRDILIFYTITFLTIISGTAWWTWTHPTTNPNSQQPSTSQLQNPQATTNQNTLSPANSGNIKNIPLPKVENSANPQLAEKIKTREKVKVQNQKIAPTKVNPAITRLEPETYWLKLEGQKIRLVPQKIAVKEGVSPEVALKQAFNHLLTIPQTNETKTLTTTIPADTKLLNLEFKDNEIRVNLSKEFTKGGGSTSMIYRVAQVVYTASSIKPNARVYLLVEGKLLNENYPLGGEGLVLTEPVTRQQLVEDFSIS
jgi:spore germination protein GerM